MWLLSSYKMAAVGCTSSGEQHMELVSDSHFGAFSTKQEPHIKKRDEIPGVI